MQRRTFLAAAPMLALMGMQAGALESSTGTLRVTEMAAGLDTPWAFGPMGYLLQPELPQTQFAGSSHPTALLFVILRYL